MKNLQVKTSHACQRSFLRRVSLYGLFCSTGPYSPPPDSISCTLDSTYLLYIPLSLNLIYTNLGVQYNLQFLSVLTHISMQISGLELR